MRAVIAIGGRLPLLFLAIIMIERWNTLASKASPVYIIYAPFSFLFFFLLFFSFSGGRANISIAAKPWQPMSDERTATFNEPVVSGTSHGYHRTGCRQLKLLRPLFSLSKSWQINHNCCESSESIFRVTASAAGSSNCSRSQALLIASTDWINGFPFANLRSNTACYTL